MGHGRTGFAIAVAASAEDATDASQTLLWFIVATLARHLTMVKVLVSQVGQLQTQHIIRCSAGVT